MKRKLFLFVGLIICMHANSQMLDLIASAGGHFENTSGSISYSMGEIATQTCNNQTLCITQGFMQTMLSNVTPAFISGVGLTRSVRVYPNPVTEFIWIEIQDFKELAYSLYDLQGALLEQNLFVDQITKIDLSALPSATYMIRVSDSKGNSKNVLIVKP